MMPLVCRHEEASPMARIVVAVGAPIIDFHAGTAVRTGSGCQLVDLGIVLAVEMKRRRDWHEGALVHWTDARCVSNEQLDLETGIRGDEANGHEACAGPGTLPRLFLQDGFFARRRTDVGQRRQVVVRSGFRDRTLTL